MKLSSSSIKDTIAKLNNLQKDLDGASEQIVEELANLGLSEIQKNYSNTPFKDGNDDVNFFQTGTNKKKKIGVTGSQVLYNEFGTGTEGEQSPHPEKGEYGLNAYNSGKTIRENNKEDSIATMQGIPKNGLYWTYYVGNEKIYTQGIPAGKQVYNAKNEIQKSKNKIIEKVVGDALSKL